MQFFDRPRTRIALRGSSTRSATSQQLVAEAKKARLQRAHLRAQHAAATSIQSAYRARHALNLAAEQLATHPRTACDTRASLSSLLLVAGLLAEQPNCTSARLALLSRRVAVRTFLPRFVSLLADALHTDHVPQRLSSMPERMIVDAVVLIVALVNHQLESQPSSQHLQSNNHSSMLTFCTRALSTALTLTRRLTANSLLPQAKSALFVHIANLFKSFASLPVPQPLFTSLTHLTDALLTLLSQSNVPSNVSNLLYRQFAISSLCISSFLRVYPLAIDSRLRKRLIHALAYPEHPPSEHAFDWDYAGNLECLSERQSTIMLSNILQAQHSSWNISDQDALSSLTMVISKLLSSLPKNVTLVDPSKVDDDDDDEDLMDEIIDEKAASEALEMKQVVKKLSVSMTQIVSEDNVRALMAVAVRQGRDAIINVCKLFSFLLRKHPAMTNSFQTALACWRRPRSGPKEHILRSLWRTCREAYSDGESPSSSSDELLTISSDTSPVLLVFTTVYSYLLYIQDADEMFDSEWPFSIEEVRHIASVMKGFLYIAIFVRPLYSLPGGTDIQNAAILREEPGLVEEISRLLSRLYACDSQRSFRTDDFFWLAGRGTLSSTSFLQDAIEAGPEALLRAPSVTSINGIRQASYGTSRKSTISGAAELLRIAPFLIPFSSRAKIFQNWIAEERKKANGGEFFFPSASHRLSVRRNFIFQDAYRVLNVLGPTLKSTIRVKFIDEHGIEEAGIDGGGVFKEFMHEVLRIGFSPYPYGLFKETPDGLLYPNPDAPVGNEDFKQQFAFLGRLLGKAVFDGVLVNVPLAKFFLSKMLGQFNYPIDLGSLDPELYKHMKFLKSCDPSMVEDLGLNFTVANNAYGSVKEVELVKNGRNIPVTAANRIEYMHRVANYRMNTQIREQSEAFLRGFSEVVPSHFIRLFSHEELQLLICGKTGQIDLEDLRRNTNYSGGYDEDTPVVRWFWEVMEELNPEEQSKMLQFVTSSPRAPLLGFSYLVPSFCIHRAEGDIRLPTASTCMNLLKLPQYKSLSVVREKIRYALDSNAGFDLS
ncbi:unnamed protein product [Agarophyton chilense]